MRSILLVYIFIGVASALKCYQGMQNASQPISGSSAECPTPSLSCLKSYDNTTNTVTRSCQTTNCTLNGIPSSTGFCQNTTAYPFQTYCCCYSDGCNGVGSHSSLILRLGWFVIPLLVAIAYSTK